MKKITLSLLVALVAGATSLFAQSVDQGKNFFYYERYKSAKAEFEKVLAARSNDEDATYWLGQTLLEQKDMAGAKALYQKALAADGSAPLVLIGMGHIELLENKPDEARQRFETAISLSKKKDGDDVVIAIGRAYADPKVRGVDANYAIEKLEAATQAKKFNNPQVYLVLGDAYRKNMDGGGAVTAYTKASTMNPNLAAAFYRIGRIYLTQNNKDMFLNYFERAIFADANYAPAYYEMYYYWFNRDINKAKDFYAKYKAVADVDASNDYDETSIKYASKDYNGAIQQAKADLAKYGEKADPRYYKLIAYAYDELKDSVSAKNYLDQYFDKQDEGSFVPKDFEFRAKILAKFPGNESQIFNNYKIAINLDTAYDSKMELLNSAVNLAKKLNNKAEEAYWLGASYKENKNPSNRDLYDWGYASYQAGAFPTADSVFSLYIGKYPDEIYGYLWSARSKQAQDDSVNSKGLAVDAYKLLAEKAREIDSVKLKSQIITSYFFLVQYYNDIKKDKETAISYLDKVLEVDPGNETALKFKGILTRPRTQLATPSKKPEAAVRKSASSDAKRK